MESIMRTVSILSIVLVAICSFYSVANAEIALLRNESGITSHVLVNGVVYPIDNQGKVMINGRTYGYDELMMFSASPPQPVVYQQPSGYVNNPFQTTSQPGIDFKHTMNGVRQDLRREARRTLGYGFGSGMAVGVVEDVLDSMFR
jgi:hypothetical protein